MSRWWRDKPLEKQVELLEHFLVRRESEYAKARRLLALITEAITPDYQRNPEVGGRSPDLGESWAAWADHPAIHPLIEALLDVGSGFNNDIHKSGPPMPGDDAETLERKARFWFHAAERYARNASTAFCEVCRQFCDRAKDDPEHFAGDGGCVFLPFPAPPTVGRAGEVAADQDPQGDSGPRA